MMIYQEKIEAPGPLPDLTIEPADVLSSQRTMDSLKQENSWLKQRLADIMLRVKK